jgi:hypothetical protein
MFLFSRFFQSIRLGGIQFQIRLLLLNTPCEWATQKKKRNPGNVTPDRLFSAITRSVQNLLCTICVRFCQFTFFTCVDGHKVGGLGNYLGGLEIIRQKFGIGFDKAWQSSTWRQQCIVSNVPSNFGAFQFAWNHEAVVYQNVCLWLFLANVMLFILLVSFFCFLLSFLFCDLSCFVILLTRPLFVVVLFVICEFNLMILVLNLRWSSGYHACSNLLDCAMTKL